MESIHNEDGADDIVPPDFSALQDAAPLAGEVVFNRLRRPALQVTPLIGLGSVNLIFCVDTAEGQVVVRLNKPEDDATKTRGDYEKERWCIQRAAEAGIPGPEVLAVGEHSGRAFMLQNRIPGVNGKQSAMPPSELMSILGRYARTIHSLPADGFGDTVAAFERGSAQQGWLRFLDYNIAALTDRDPLLALAVYRPDQQATIRAAFTWLRSLPLRIGLNHGDLARRNTIVDENGRVSLLDWGCAEIQVVPHYDLNALLLIYRPDSISLRAFLDGYGITGSAWARLRPELDAFALLKAFDLTRWAIDRCPARIGEIAQRAALNVSRYHETA